MSLAQTIAAEFQQEAANTRRVLERVPAEKFEWRPHPKSYTMGQLATHVAQLAHWLPMTCTSDEFDLAPDRKAALATSTADLLERHDAGVKSGIEELAKISEADLQKPWSLRKGEHVVFTLPKAAVIRTAVLNHIVHHRAQLTVYLRLNDIPVPGIYGPSADEM